MLPDHVLSSPTQEAAFLPDQAYIDSKRIAYSIGGIALNDSSQGPSVQLWTATLDVSLSGLGSVYIESATHAKSLLFTLNGVTEVSLTFDQNMQPVVGYLAFGQGGIYWFDGTVPGFVFFDFVGVTNCPRVTLDDRQQLDVASSDVLVFYTKTGNLYFREQRDRYLVEYLLKTGVVGSVLKVAMGVDNRIQGIIGLSL
jgi:hypothetical protein